MRSISVLFMLALAGALVFFCPASSYAQARADVSSQLMWGSAQLVFSWDSHEKVPFDMQTQGDKVVLHFESPVALRWKQALPAISSYVTRVETSADSQTVTLTLRHPARARDYIVDGKEGIDQSENGIELVRTKARAPVNTMAYAPLTPAKHKLASHAQAQPKPVRKKITLARNAYHHPARKVQTAQNLARLSPSAGDSSSYTVAAASPVAPVTVAPLKAAAPAPLQPATPTPAPTVQPNAELSVKEILLPVKSQEPLAVFTSHNALWIVSAPSAALSADALQAVNPNLNRKFEQIPNATASILMLPQIGALSATMEKASKETRIVLQKTAPEFAPSLPIALMPGSVGQALTVTASKSELLATLRDPVTGEEIKVIPLPASGAGIASTHSFVQFTLLASAQGVVVQKQADNIDVSLQAGVVKIASPQGLEISPEVAAQLQEEASDNHAPGVLFPYARWKLSDEKNLVPTERSLVHDIAYGTPESSTKARLRLLHLYLAEGLFLEARGEASDILRVSYKSYRDNKVALARGVANFFAYHLSEAERDFSAPELMNLPEAAMWRTLCREMLGESKETFDFVANYDHIIRYYPPSFIQKLAIIAADRSINRKNYDAANTIFSLLKKDNLDEPVRKYVDYMHAKILSETNDESEAARIWANQAADVSDRLIRARAEFSLVNMLLRQGKITSQDAEKRLEKLRVVWRDDSLELSVLTLLGNLYIEDKQYANALYTLRDIVLYYPDSPEAVTTARTMESLFVLLFNKGGADTMPPLQALALFYQFRDLVPLGKGGDEMIQNLADRLVGIDLLDRATLLLNHQVQKRLQGEERSRVGTHLAAIYLMNHQPKEALETLKTTGYGTLPADLQLARMRLTAQALAQQGQMQKAIDVLSNDTSAQGSIERLAIYWQNKDWTNVVSVAEEILANRNDPSAPLTLDESDVLLKLATAYVYEHDTGQIQYLRDYFTPLLKDNPNKSSFLFITSESGTIDYENLSNLTQDITTVKSFISAPDTTLKKNAPASAVN